MSSFIMYFLRWVLLNLPLMTGGGAPRIIPPLIPPIIGGRPVNHKTEIRFILMIMLLMQMKDLQAP